MLLEGEIMEQQERTKLRMEIRGLLETGKLQWRSQAKFAKTYNVSRQYIHQIFKEERKRLENPVSWELEREKKRRKKPGSVKSTNISKLLEEHQNHPAFQKNQDPEN